MGDAIDGVESWAELELAPWHGWSPDVRTFEAKLERLAATDKAIYLFEIDGYDVRFDDKGIPSGTADPTHGYHNAMVLRGQGYARFFSQALAAFGVSGRACFAINLGDLTETRTDLPVFAFQRRRYDAVPLIPDIEMIHYDFYIDDRFGDPIAFADKDRSAIFIGSTTGDMVLTREHVDRNLNTRIRAARFFKGKDGVIFHLPKIVQCDTPQTHALIESLGVQGKARDWASQVAHRFLISLDGNGAACSRPYLALAGQGVLLKYNSPNELYYFRGLRPWYEYIPIRTESEVLAVVERADRSIDQHAAIAARSRRFIMRNVSRIHAMEYSAEILERYIAQFGRGGPRQVRWPRETSFVVDTYVHLGTAGALWSAPAGWSGEGGRPIEDFTIVAGHGLDQDEIIYAAIDADGRRIECGAGRAGKGIHGLVVALTGAARARYRLAYQARFSDGFESGLVKAGTTLWRPAAAMTAFRLVVLPRRKSSSALAHGWRLPSKVR